MMRECDKCKRLHKLSIMVHLEIPQALDAYFCPACWKVVKRKFKEWVSNNNNNQGV